MGELIAELHAEKIRFLIVGMSAAVLQGAPMATVDTDIWIDLPVRSYVRVAQRIGANILSGSVLGLRDDHRVDFIYRIDGLASFGTEWKRALSLQWAGHDVRVLPLARIIRSKEVSNRPKDVATLPVLRDYLASTKLLK